MLILYNPVSSPSRKPVLPMSLLALGAVLEGRVDYCIVDGNLQDGDEYEALIRCLSRVEAPRLAMTVMPGPQLVNAVGLVGRLKAQMPGLEIIWGGYFPTMHAETVLASGVVDFVFRGHSELAFAAFVEKRVRGESGFDEPGLAWRDPATGELRRNPLAPVPSPEDLPDFPYHRVEMSTYVRPSYLGARTLSHHASYGCPFHCNFCAVVKMVEGRYLGQSPERMANVVSQLVREYGADSVEFHDSNFFVKESRIAEFSDRVKPLGIGWWGLGRADTMLQFSDETFAKMRDSGLKMVFMGAEAGSDEMLKQMNKGGRQTVDSVLAIAEKMRRFDIVPEMSFVLGNPPDPRADLERTIRFIRRVKDVNPATEIILYLYSPVALEGDLYAEATAQGFDFPQTLEEWASPQWEDFAQHRTSTLPWLDPSFRRQIKDFQRVLHAAYPTVTDPGLRGPARFLMRALGGWRYRLGVYRHPLELRLLNRLFPYQRPETSGF